MTVFTIPAGTPLRSENMGATLKSEAVVVCHDSDAWLIRAALNLTDAGQRLSTSVNQSAPPLSIPDQAASLPVMSTTNNSSLESKNCASQACTCAGECGVSTIQVVVNLHQRVGKV